MSNQSDPPLMHYTLFGFDESTDVEESDAQFISRHSVHKPS